MVAKTPHFALHKAALAAFAASDSAGSDLFRAQGTWLGAMVPKRWAKRAVTRNAIKRQIYSVGDELAQQFPAAAFLVRLRRDFSKKEFPSAVSEPLRQAVRLEVQLLLRSVTSIEAELPTEPARRPPV